VQLVKMALKRGQFYLCAEILRFLTPPREGVMQWGPGSPLGGSAAAKDASGSAAAAAGAKPGAVPQLKPSGSAAAAGGSGQGGWFSWIWGSSGSSQQQQQQQQLDETNKQQLGGGGDVTAAGVGGKGLVSQGSPSAAGGMEHGSDACREVADKAWKLLYTVSILRIWACHASSPACDLLPRQRMCPAVSGGLQETLCINPCDGATEHQLQVGLAMPYASTHLLSATPFASQSAPHSAD
jgi:hypothetical protein